MGVIKIRQVGLCSTACLLAFLVTSPALAQATVAGRVVTSGGEPVLRAEIEVFERDRSLTRFPRPVDLQGRFEIDLRGFSGTHLTCVFSAPRYRPRRLTFMVVKGRVDTGDVVLDAAPTVSMGGLHHFIAADGRSQGIDLFVEKEAAEPVEIQRVKVYGIRRAQTECLTGAPSFILDFRETSAADSWIAEISQPDSGWKDAVRASAEVEILPCEQIRAAFEVPVLLAVDNEKKEKLRIKLPRTVRAKGDEGLSEHMLDLETWSQVIVELVLKEGQKVQASLRPLPRSAGGGGNAD